MVLNPVSSGREMKNIKEILTVCLKCGKKADKKHKIAFGMWEDTCDICGRKDWCASAPHDFGIYSTKEIEENDKVQDLL